MVSQLRLLSRRGKLGNSRGNIFAMLFAAVALTGVLASVGMQTLTGPVTTITRVTQKNIADNNLLMNGKILVSAAVSGVSGGDTDNDGIIEPTSFVAPGGGEQAPAGGGFLPTTLGLALTDPWGSRYGYCVWDHGTSNSSSGRLTGDNTDDASTQPVIAIIAAGPDKIFQSSCPSYSGNTIIVAKAGGSDDLIFRYTYAEATASSNGLWTLSPTDQTKAQLKDASGIASVTIDRSSGVGRFYGIVTDTLAAATDILTLDGGLKLDTETNVSTCTAAEAGVVRYNSARAKLEICSGSVWKPAGSSEATYITQTPSDDLEAEQALSLLPSGVLKVTTGTGVITSGPVDLGSDEASGILAGGRFPALTGEVTTSAGSLVTSVADDALDFSELKDAMTLDAPTDIAVTGTDVLSITNTGTGSSFVVNDEAGDTTPLVIDGDGRVGIGTATPAHTLHVAGSLYFRNSAQGNDNGSARIVGSAIGVNTPIYSFIGNTGSGMSGDGANGLKLITNASVKFVITASGNVGIGTTSPQARLDVVGGVKVGADAVCNASKAGMVAWNANEFQICDGVAFRRISAIDRLDDIGDVYLSETGNAEPNDRDILAWNAADNRWEARNVSTVGSAVATPGGTDKQVQFNDGGSLGGAAQMIWDKATSRLGVGTVAPTTALHVVGKITGNRVILPPTTGLGMPASYPAPSGTSTCTTAVEGTLRYNTLSKTYEFCNGSVWSSFFSQASQPNAFAFTDVTGATPAATVTSNAVTLAGFPGALTASCSGCTAIARNGAWGGTIVSGFMQGDTIAVRTTASASFSTAVTSTVSVGGTVSGAWTVSTVSNVGPSAFGFTAVSNATTSITYTSNTVTLSGFTGTLTATCTGCTSIARNGVWGISPYAGFVSGDTIAIRQTSSNGAGVMTTAAVTLGATTSSAWGVTTAAACAAGIVAGQACPDGSIFAGFSPDGNVAMYTTPCDAGQTLSGVMCTGTRSGIRWNNGTSNWTATGFTSQVTGLANTAGLVALFDAGAPYNAAAYCDGLTAHGSSDWYLPARNELNVLYTNRTAIGGFDVAGGQWYWSSSESGNSLAWVQRFSDGSNGNSAKGTSYFVRCARR